MIRLNRLFGLLVVLILVVPLLVLSAIHYLGLKQFATQTLSGEVESEGIAIRDHLQNELGAMSGGIRLLAGHETIIKGSSSLYYGAQVRDRFETFMNRYHIVSSLYLLGSDGKVREKMGGRLRPLESSTTIQSLLGQLAKERENMGPSGRVVLLNDAELVPEGNHSGIVFIMAIRSVLLRGPEALQGYLVAIVPYQNLLLLARGTNDTNRSVLDVGDRLAPDLPGWISKVQVLEVAGRDYSPSLDLYVRISRSPESMRVAVFEAIRPFISYQLLVFLLLIGVCVLLVRPVFRAFNQLFITIRRIQSGQPVSVSQTRIWEFANTERLLVEMQHQLGRQFSELEDNNRELAQLSSEKDAYLSELTRLNQDLEGMVKERTSALENTLDRLGVTNRINGQIIAMRQALDNEMSAAEVLEVVVHHLHACQTCAPFAVLIDTGDAPHCLYQDPAFTVELDMQQIALPHRGLVGEIWYIPLPPPYANCQLMLQTSALPEEVEQGLELFVRELSGYLENRALNRQLAFWARTDGLTGLGNRIAFDQRMGLLETSLDDEIGLLLIDVNGLKRLNDTRGHDAGDALLRIVAERLRQCMYGITGELYRIGGDEFVILLAGDGMAFKDVLMQRLLQQQHSPATLVGQEYGVSFSYGYADSRQTPFSLLYKLADKLMYQQKQGYYEQLRRQGAPGLEESAESV